MSSNEYFSPNSTEWNTSLSSALDAALNLEIRDLILRTASEMAARNAISQKRWRPVRAQKNLKKNHK